VSVGFRTTTPGKSTEVSDRACTACRSVALEAGFLEDMGENSQGYSRWIAGPLERGLFGGAKRMGKERYPVEALRCTVCGHLELYVGEPDREA
jgi:hypothetical protein